MTTITIGSRTGNTFSGFADLLIQGALPSVNNISSQNHSVVGGATAADRQHILISVPGMTANVAGPISASAGTKITLRAADPGTALNVALYKLLVPWVEAEATWNKRNTATNWTTAGALGTSDVVSLTPIATGTVPATATDFDLTGEGLTADFEAVVNGTSNDYGYLLCADPDTVAVSRRLRATENLAVAAERPFATLVYTALSVSASIGDVSVDRTDGTATVPVTLSGPAPAGGVTVNYATQDDTATAPAYYTGTSGTLTFAEGETTKSVTVSITA